MIISRENKERSRDWEKKRVKVPFGFLNFGRDN